ncbi:4'-phosphopantetheinyl transferase family protein [uncultured Methylobacterium sp.]|uniref:4'-phosphopantetheinyl transferase family protein n=1 Tax=uncultured Methylobacterium sp. TaxID=157278 RepID=UPI0035CA21D5
MSGAAWAVTEPGPAAENRVWTVDLALSEARLACCAALLSPEEAARVDRFLRREDGDRYRASHAALRLILAAALDAAPAEIAFTTGPAGKPELAGRLAGALRFNLSHSGTRALVGVARRTAIGVDVEALRPIPDALRIARAHFSAQEVAALAAAPRSAIEACFTGLWTRKEAVVKALGAGLSLPLDRFTLTLPPAAPRLLAIADDAPEAWSLHHLEPGPGTVGTAALRAADAGVALCALAPTWPDRPT